jgi:hypothetical protein
MQLEPVDPQQKKNERLTRQIKALRSGNRTTILDAIREIRSDSDVSILPELIQLLPEQEDDEITLAVSSLLNDLKMQDAVPFLVEALSDPEYQPVAQIIAAACWQNGLSYGKYASVFVDAAIRGNYQTTIEAFTVLEETVGELEKKEREELIATIKHQLSAVDEQKKLLLRELIKVITNY